MINFQKNFILLRLSYLRQIWRHAVISLDFNLQFTKECLKYKALNMTFERGPLLSQKYNILQTRSQKLPKWRWKYMIWKEKDLNVRITFFPCHNVLRQRGEICLISIILAINHCVVLDFFTFYVAWRACRKNLTLWVCYADKVVKLSFF